MPALTFSPQTQAVRDDDDHHFSSAGELRALLSVDDADNPFWSVNK